MKQLKTVGDFKEVRLEFVFGDRCKTEDKLTSYTMNQDMVNAVNFALSNIHALSYEIESFAWRKSTGVKPEFEGLVEVKFEDGVTCCSHKPNTWWWEQKDTHINITEWRPYLPTVETETQLAKGLDEALHGTDEQKEDLRRYKAGIKTETPEGKEVFDKMNTNREAKPIFTQEMADRGELPPVGSECLVVGMANYSRLSDFNNHKVEILSICDYDKTKKLLTFCHRVLGVGCGIYHSQYFKPIYTRTEKEKCIDNALKVIRDDNTQYNSWEDCLDFMYEDGLLAK